MRRTIGWAYCYFWYCSILAGYATFFCPLLPIVFISNKLYRYLTDIFFTFWQVYPTALLEIVCGCVFQITGDAIPTGETSLLIMNHRTRTDWNFFWPTLYHCVQGKGRMAHSTKYVLKDAIRHIPGPGWVMQLACFLYIKRNWEFDKDIFKDYVKYISNISYKHSILLFPEGTDLTEKTKGISDRYAEKNNKQKYDYILHPRTSGFIFLTQQLLSDNNLDALYDVTLVYPDSVPQNEKMLLMGQFPNDVKVHFVRYPQEVLPRTEEGLRSFLEKRWLDKEKTMKEFYATGQFLHGPELKCKNRRELYTALAFWSVLPYITLYLIVYHTWFRNIVLGHTLFLIILNVFFSGFQNFEIGLYRWKQYICSYIWFDNQKNR